MINRIRRSLLTPGVPLNCARRAAQCESGISVTKDTVVIVSTRVTNPIDRRLRVDTHRASRQEDEIHHRRADQPYL